ncbi:hypothetical protein NVP1154O_52 [Vibrio phage 1.154.O._10N.222.52.B12]|nr:hypothetical protein NVP1154O_52 [Vibrio phage 1.154.O._10N.222.52.B12]
MITVTLQQIKHARPCEGGWKKVLKANGGSKADFNKPFPLVSILDSNDLDDTLWVISSVKSMREHDEIWRKFSSWCALQNIDKISEYCSSEDYKLIVNWLETNDPDLRESAESAARSAAESAWSAAWSAARSAAESAAESAARSAARSAAWSARSAAESAWSAARSAWSAAESAQEKKLRDLLGGE